MTSVLCLQELHAYGSDYYDLAFHLDKHLCVIIYAYREHAYCMSGPYT